MSEQSDVALKRHQDFDRAAHWWGLKLDPIQRKKAYLYLDRNPDTDPKKLARLIAEQWKAEQREEARG